VELNMIGETSEPTVRSFDGRTIGAEPEAWRKSPPVRKPGTWKMVAIPCPFGCERKVIFGRIKPHLKARHLEVEAGQWNARSPQMGRKFLAAKVEARAIFDPARWGPKSPVTLRSSSWH
jgi:hypothetical protein